MSTDEAVQLVLLAAAVTRGRHVLALEMGEQVNIYDLAERMIRLCGYQPGVDIPIEITGMLPGEKLVEAVVGPAERRLASDDGPILTIEPAPLGTTALDDALDRLEALALANDRDRAREALLEIASPALRDDRCRGVRRSAASRDSLSLNRAGAASSAPPPPRTMPLMQGAVVSVVTTPDRWLLTFIVVAAIVLAGGSLVRRAAQRASRPRSRRGPHTPGEDTPAIRGLRRRGGALIGVGAVVGLVVAPSPATLTVVAGVGAGAFALFGALVERADHADRLTWFATLAGALVAVVAGARLGPTGVEAFDVLFAFVFVVAVTQGLDGLGNVDGLASGLGTAAFAGVFGLAGFGAQDDLATVALGMAVACFTFLAFNLRPASLFVGRAGRLAIGYGLAVSALAVDPVPGPGRELATPLILLGVVLLDVGVVGVDRLRRRRPLSAHRSDHLVHRLAALGWSPSEAVVLLVLAFLH